MVATSPITTLTVRTERVSPLERVRARAVPIALLGIMLLAALLRFTGQNWDDGQNLHPDERFVTMVATSITWAVVRVSDQPADAEHHYGHGKFESLSALGVTALLYLLAGGILVEAWSRLREGAPPPTISAVPFVVLVIDIVVNYWRARALHRAARETRSQALEADALHFTSDMLGSFAVIAGLILAGLGFWWGDAAAAIAVAVMIGLLGLKMTRATVETLLDRAPEGIAEKAEAAIRAVPGVVDVERMRVRMVGPTYFIDSIAKVPRTYPIDRVEEIKRKAQAAVRDALGDADLTFTAVPVARDNEVKVNA